jgi:hypothetical protein
LADGGTPSSSFFEGLLSAVSTDDSAAFILFSVLSGVVSVMTHLSS